MNPLSMREAQDLFGAVAQGVEGIEGVQVVLCSPFPFLSMVKSQESHIALGAQNCFWEQEGAFTGEISARMLKNLGCSYVIIGHSERKRYLGETFQMIRQKMQAALETELIPIVCLGEREKNNGARKEFERQMREIFKGIKLTSPGDIVPVYEPEWAISAWSNGISATPQDAKDALLHMRNVLADMFGKEFAKEMHLLYGGSVDENNIRAFMETGAMQGALVGSASLSAKKFISLVKNAAL